ncbi:MAG: hypothetical protein A3A57_01750 [Candidatus Woykebacteria bacterium RIFCSPLOWO2_01_FULL_41_12]|uniref:Uncharacterized protein n=1 Tax=Candidatus Woykebacteria bacterium RIFCSPLOWO2_01_FULL_41_12 TaxID=1802604 RepID=A0A1G1WUY6_9BACT|nr:MAG: hypothetical protein A3A57_01750 [Candidatus Woykebacteria bacterium RIFCSPLOWO2_01_FULL_41_12]
MAQDINLLPEITEEEVRKSTYTRRVNFVAIASLLVIGTILLAVFGYWLFLAANSERLKVQTKNAEEQILSPSLTRKEITRRSLVERLNEAGQFVSSVIPYSESIDKIIKFFSASKVSLTENEFKDSGDQTLIGEFVSPSHFKTLTDKFISEGETENFDNVTLVSLTKEELDEKTGKEGNYIFNLGMKYLKKGISGVTSSSTNQ